MKTRKVISILLTAALMLTLLSALATPPALAAGATTLAAQINAIPGLTATAGANTVTVTGAVSITANSARIALNIDPDVTVYWQANLSSTLATTNYAITLSGGGTFEISSCTISNITGTATNSIAGRTPEETIIVFPYGIVLAIKIANRS